MMQNIKDLVDALWKRRDRRLQRQWQEHYDLPPREVKAGLPKKKGNLYQQWAEEGSLVPEDMPQELPVSSVIPKKSADTLLVKRLTRYIIIEGIIIVILLVSLAVVATMLAVKAG